MYLRHLVGNWIVAFKALVLFVFHLLHGLIPVKYTSHDYWGFRLMEKDDDEERE